MNPPRSLPFSEDAEKALLCSMIRSQDVLLNCASILPRQFFYVPAHDIIFSALCDLNDDGVPIDFVTLKAALNRTQQLAEVGGPEYLSALWEFVPTSGNWRFYAELLAENYRRRVTIIECQRLIEKMYDPQTVAEQSVRETVEQTLTKLALSIASSEKTFRRLVSETLEAIEQRARSQTVAGIRFDLKTLDEEFDGVQPGELCVICGQTSGGKSALALQAIIHAARRGVGAALFSLEMPGTQIVERVLAFDGQISMKVIRSGRFTESDLAKLHASVARIGQHPIFVEEDSTSDVNQIINRCRTLKVKHGIALVVVDYLQLVQPVLSRRDATREREVAEISRKLKALAVELKVSVLALSQLNDKGQLRESRAIGQDADIVLKIDESEAENAFAVDIVIDKHRSAARDKRVTVEFFGEYMKFKDAHLTPKNAAGYVRAKTTR